MKTDPTVAAALNVYRMMLTRVKWRVAPPENATETEKQRAKFVESCMSDMEGTWSQFMAEVVTYLEYGFSVQEKVFRRRLTRNGSKYSDGLVGLA
jgi:phage gp29-like protein